MLPVRRADHVWAVPIPQKACSGSLKASQKRPCMHSAVIAAQGRRQEEASDIYDAPLRNGQTRLATRVTTLPRRVDLYFAGDIIPCAQIIWSFLQCTILKASVLGAVFRFVMSWPCRKLLPSSDLGSHSLLRGILLCKHSLAILWSIGNQWCSSCSCHRPFLWGKRILMLKCPLLKSKEGKSTS